MQKNLYNLTNPQSPLNENHPKRVLIWVIIILIIFGVGFLVYKKYKNKDYTFEQKIDILNSVDSGENPRSNEEKEQILNEFDNPVEDQSYPNDKKLEILNNL